MASILSRIKRTLGQEPVEHTETHADVAVSEANVCADICGEPTATPLCTEAPVPAVPPCPSSAESRYAGTESRPDQTAPADIASRQDEPRWIPCRACGGAVTLVPYDGDTSRTSPDAGIWYALNCRCGFSGYICDRDYQFWLGHRMARASERPRR